MLPESKFHKRLKRKAAGSKGRIEKKIRGGRRIDAQKGRKVIEIERSGSVEGISKALNKLKTQTTFKKELHVPHKDLDKARDIAKKRNINVIIWNLSKTRRRIIRKK